MLVLDILCLENVDFCLSLLIQCASDGVQYDGMFALKCQNGIIHSLLISFSLLLLLLVNFLYFLTKIIDLLIAVLPVNKYFLSKLVDCL